MARAITQARIKQLWIESELSETEFGVKKLGIRNAKSARRQVRSWIGTDGKASEPVASNLRKIAESCGVTTDWLVGRTDSRTGRVDVRDAVYRDIVRGLSEDDLRFLPQLAKVRTNAVAKRKLYDGMIQTMQTVMAKEAADRRRRINETASHLLRADRLAHTRDGR